MPTTHPTPVFHGPVHAHWREMAAAKGFDLIARINDRYHLHLRCRTCGGGFTAKLFTLMRHQPLCPNCLAARRSAVAQRRGSPSSAPIRIGAAMAGSAPPAAMFWRGSSS